MIHIGVPYITEKDDRAFLKAKITVSEDTAQAYTKGIIPVKDSCVWLTDEDYPPAAWDEDGTLWFDVPLEYKRYLCKERSNAFVIALFWYAMVSGSDIEFEVPMSKRLYDGLTTMLMPALHEKGFGSVRLIGPVTAEPVWCEGGVVAGMSGGVDSHYTLKCYSSESVPREQRLTHLCHYTCSYLFKPGDLEKGLEALYQDEDRIEAIILQTAKNVAQAKGFPLVDTNTNLDKDFYRGGYVFMAMYRYLSCTLALEHLYATYISSSTGHSGRVYEESLFVPTQHYEALLCKSLRTESFSYISSDDDARIHKISVLADDKVFQDNLAVCFATGSKGENCGRCYGCMKTMIPLDFLGKLDLFAKSFDLESYEKDREEIYRYLIRFSKRPEAFSARETIRQLLELNENRPSPKGDLFKSIYESEIIKE